MRKPPTRLESNRYSSAWPSRTNPPSLISFRAGAGPIDSTLSVLRERRRRRSRNGGTYVGRNQASISPIHRAIPYEIRRPLARNGRAARGGADLNRIGLSSCRDRSPRAHQHAIRPAPRAVGFSFFLRVAVAQEPHPPDI